VNIDYIELPVTDIDAAKTFYGKAFGWTFQDWAPQYASFSKAGIEGGFRKTSEPPPRGGALVVLFADDLGAAEHAVTDAGGEITERHEFPGGRRFHFIDPAGNELAVWTKA
jgi:hypothetical protein